MGFVCAFRGRRDSYQVPLALSEAGQLDRFITDYYFSGIEGRISRWLPQNLTERLSRRSDGRIPPGRVSRLNAVALLEWTLRRAGVPPAEMYDICDALYSRAAARRARRSRSDLLMYSSYAWEAFNASFSHNPRKILFQFHPHTETEQSILLDDLKRCEGLKITFTGQFEDRTLNPTRSRRRTDEAWRLAHHVICASSFTKNSLVKAGADPSRVSVVPYGGAERTETRPGGRVVPPTDHFHALFVGSGVHRKGLHWLLLAWRQARLPRNAHLTIVSRVVDPGLRPLLEGQTRVTLLEGVSHEELERLYGAATLFVMPSLVEGFGLVYLEALSHGLPVLGTRNTGLPDLGGEDDGIFLTEPGDVDHLTVMLQRLSEQLPAQIEITRRARMCASRYTWEKFRSGIRLVASSGAIHSPSGVTPLQILESGA
jgi:glycosyltransferase involved in cell wall biosynthesis